jgi:hypothetical protein
LRLAVSAELLRIAFDIGHDLIDLDRSRLNGHLFRFVAPTLYFDQLIGHKEAQFEWFKLALASQLWRRGYRLRKNDDEVITRIISARQARRKERKRLGAEED